MKSTYVNANGLLRADAAEELFVGRLVRNVPKGIANPSEYCLDDGFLYQGASHRIGTTAVTFVGSQAPAEASSSVVVFGKRSTDWRALLRKIGPCPEGYAAEEQEQQLRSDWVAPETGFTIGHTSWEKLQKIDYIQAAYVDPLECVSVAGLEKGKPSFQLRFRNAFDVVLDKVPLTAFYDGCFTKPGGTQEVVHSTAVAAGDTFAASFPKRLERQTAGGRTLPYLVAAIGVQGRVRNITFEIKVNLRPFGRCDKAPFFD